MKLTSSILVVHFSLCCLLVETKRFVPPEEEDNIVDFLKRTVNNVAELLSEKKWEYVVVPATSRHYWTASVWTGKGKVGKFSTMTLEEGSDHFFIKTRVQRSNIYNFEVRLRLDQLSLDYLYEYSEMFFSRASGRLRITSTNNTARAKGVININDNGACNAVVESIAVSNRGKYDVGFTPPDVASSVRESLMEFSRETIIPQYMTLVNRELEGILKYVDLSQTLCESLAPYELLKTDVGVTKPSPSR